MRPSSAKAKGRKFQQWVASLLLEYSIGLEEDDLVSRPMGSPGEDIMQSPAARKQWPFDIECKSNKNGYSKIYYAIEQSSVRGRRPLVFFKQDRKEPLISMKAKDFVEIIRRLNAQ